MKSISNYTIDVDDTLTVRVWETSSYENNGDPILLQPTLPDGTPFSSSEEAYAWAEDRLNIVLNPPQVPSEEEVIQ